MDQPGESVYPTHVGMNRKQLALLLLFGRIPHARGDEPNRITAIRM